MDAKGGCNRTDGAGRIPREREDVRWGRGGLVGWLLGRRRGPEGEGEGERGGG